MYERYALHRLRQPGCRCRRQVREQPVGFRPTVERVITAKAGSTSRSRPPETGSIENSTRSGPNYGLLSGRCPLGVPMGGQD